MFVRENGKFGEKGEKFENDLIFALIVVKGFFIEEQSVLCSLKLVHFSGDGGGFLANQGDCERNKKKRK